MRACRGLERRRRISGSALGRVPTVPAPRVPGSAGSGSCGSRAGFGVHASLNPGDPVTHRPSACVLGPLCPGWGLRAAFPRQPRTSCPDCTQPCPRPGVLWGRSPCPRVPWGYGPSTLLWGRSFHVCWGQSSCPRVPWGRDPRDLPSKAPTAQAASADAVLSQAQGPLHGCRQRGTKWPHCSQLSFP